MPENQTVLKSDNLGVKEIFIQSGMTGRRNPAQMKEQMKAPKI